MKKKKNQTSIVKEEDNIAFIDGQNLYMGTKSEGTVKHFV